MEKKMRISLGVMLCVVALIAATTLVITGKVTKLAVISVDLNILMIGVLLFFLFKSINDAKIVGLALLVVKFVVNVTITMNTSLDAFTGLLLLIDIVTAFTMIADEQMEFPVYTIYGLLGSVVMTIVVACFYNDATFAFSSDMGNHNGENEIIAEIETTMHQQETTSVEETEILEDSSAEEETETSIEETTVVETSPVETTEVETFSTEETTAEATTVAVQTTENKKKFYTVGEIEYSIDGDVIEITAPDDYNITEYYNLYIIESGLKKTTQIKDHNVLSLKIEGKGELIFLEGLFEGPDGKITPRFQIGVE